MADSRRDESYFRIAPKNIAYDSKSFVSLQMNSVPRLATEHRYIFAGNSGLGRKIWVK
jgi:hypothetical protein